MYLSKWTRPYSAKSMACSAYSLFTFITVTSTYSTYSHFGLRPPVGISDLPTESGVLSNSTLCFCRFIKILDSLDFGLDNGSYVGFLFFLILVDLMGLHKPGGALPRAHFQAICGPKLVDLFLPSTVPLQPSTRLTVAIHCYHGLNLVSESCHGLGQGRKRSRFSMPLRPLRSGHSRDRKPERFWFSTTTVSKRCKTQKVTNPHILFPGHTQD